jgi:hypothetical protein
MTTTLSGRASRVLGRFPRHLDADTPGKLIGAVVQALVRDQDVQAADLQTIRLARRLGEARELHDLLLLGDLHGVRRSEMALLFTRQSEARARLAALQANLDQDGDLGEREGLAAALLSLWSLPGDTPLRPFSADPEGTNPLDVAATIERLLPRVLEGTRRRVLIDGVRARIVNTAHIHAQGNATVRALLEGAANALDLELGEIAHSEDRYWHAAPVSDRLRLHHPSDDPPPAGGAPIIPPAEYLGIEENPRVPVERGPHPRKHAQLFHYIRKGFDDALLEIRVRGVGTRTLSPMIVNRDAGHGVGVFARVPHGEELVFTQEGRVLLAGADITSRAYAWQGACFAATGPDAMVREETAAVHSRDFLFADADTSAAALEARPRTSRFARVLPAGSLDREARLPHAGDSLPMPSIGVGKTRFAFFVQQGYFSAEGPQGAGVSFALSDVAAIATSPSPLRAGDPFASTPQGIRERIRLATPRYAVGFADASLFGGDGDAAAQVRLRWLERQAYSVHLLIPNRFRAFDQAEGAQVREQVRYAVQRFRPAGVDVRVDFVEDRWVLGSAALPVTEAWRVDPITRIQSSTLLWPGPAAEETP